MTHATDSSGKVRFTYTDKSYLCEIGQHSDCGGHQCRCRCHGEKKKEE